MIVDLTIGFNEIDLFLIRYHELKDIVDRFVVCEATHTHRGTPKELYFSNWYDQAVRDISIDTGKIEIIVWDNGPDFAPTTPQYAWVRENYQREILGHWIKENCNPNDICMLSDMDEIPNANSLEQFITTKDGDAYHWDGVWRFEQILTYLYFNTSAGIWNGTKIFKASELTNIQHDRPMTDMIRYRPEDMIAGTIKQGGWHFSSVGKLERVRAKFDAYAHTEMSEKTNEDIQDSLDRHVDPFHKQPLTFIHPLKLPQYVRDNFAYFYDNGYIAEQSEDEFFT